MSAKSAKESILKTEEDAKAFLKKGGVFDDRDEKGNSPLMWAVVNGFKDITGLLLKEGADVNAKNNDGWTPLMAASAKGYANIVNKLLEYKADVNATKKDGGTALTCAAANGHLEIANELLKKGADVNVVKKDGMTALTCASANGHSKVVEKLLEKGADVNAKTKEGWTPLMYAAMRGDEKVVKQLLAKEIDVNAKKGDGATALTLATLHGYPKIAKLLVEKGADVNATKKDGWTPLMCASVRGDTATIDMLVAHGASIDAAIKTAQSLPNKTKATEVVALLETHTKEKKTAVASNQTPETRPLQPQATVVPSQPSINREATLFQAIQKKDEATALQLLTDGKANHRAKDENGWSLLMHASAQGQAKVVQTLVGKGADVNATEPRYGITALMLATLKGHLEVVKQLVENGAKVNAAARGKTALDMAKAKIEEEHGKSSADQGIMAKLIGIGQVLRSHGAKFSQELKRSAPSFLPCQYAGNALGENVAQPALEEERGRNIVNLEERKRSKTPTFFAENAMDAYLSPKGGNQQERPWAEQQAA